MICINVSLITMYEELLLCMKNHKIGINRERANIIYEKSGSLANKYIICLYLKIPSERGMSFVLEYDCFH